MCVIRVKKRPFGRFVSGSLDSAAELISRHLGRKLEMKLSFLRIDNDELINRSDILGVLFGGTDQFLMVVVLDRELGRRHPVGPNPGVSTIAPLGRGLNYPPNKSFRRAAKKLLFALPNGSVAIAADPSKHEPFLEAA